MMPLTSSSTIEGRPDPSFLLSDPVPSYRLMNLKTPAPVVVNPLEASNRQIFVASYPR